MLPEVFLQRLQQLCPADLLDSVCNSFNQQKLTSWRVNNLSADAEQVNVQLQQLGLTPTDLPWASGYDTAVFTCPPAQREILTRSAAAEQGQIYIQNPSSMLVAWMLDPQQTDWVLDLAAAPGSKTTLLAAMMNNEGKISAVESVKGRFFKLKVNLERCGVTNTTCYLKDGRVVGRLKPNTFDKVLLDAPCSSESRFDSRQPDSFSHWSLKKVKECAKKQRGLILSGFDALKPGGTMIYSTCSFSPEENEMTVDYLLNKRAAASVAPIDMPANMPEEYYSPGLLQWENRRYHPGLYLTRRIWPNQIMDGFFLAKIKKD